MCDSIPGLMSLCDDLDYKTGRCSLQPAQLVASAAFIKKKQKKTFEPALHVVHGGRIERGLLQGETERWEKEKAGCFHRSRLKNFKERQRGSENNVVASVLFVDEADDSHLHLQLTSP